MLGPDVSEREIKEHLTRNSELSVGSPLRSWVNENTQLGAVTSEESFLPNRVWDGGETDVGQTRPEAKDCTQPQRV